MKFDVHELALIFPKMDDDSFNELVKDITENGLLEPITLYEGKILDGRHRYNACMKIGLVPEYDEYTGGDPLQFVVSKNAHRRHLSSSQKAVIALKILPYLETKAKERQIRKPTLSVPEIMPEQKDAREEAAEMFGTNARYVSDAKMIEREAPELLDEIMNGEITIPEAKKTLRTQELAQQRAVIADSVQDIPQSDRWNIYQASIDSWIPNKQYDFIITDPPYPKEYLPLWETLAIKATEWLKPGGLLIAMSGQSYLDQIYQMMSNHLIYYWTGCYLTPGQPTPLRHVNVNTTWKPLLIYRNDKYTGKIFGDVFKSDGNDKDFHKWGQSISGMYDIVHKICLPGQSILDPFCGAGTTGIAALQHGCLFDGIDIDVQNVNISKARLQEYD